MKAALRSLRFWLSLNSVFVLHCSLVAPTIVAQQPSPEITTEEKPTTFKLRVNLVQVYVVVRDAKGNAVPGLKKEDFRLLDQGKPQVITNFAVDSPETRLQRVQAEAKVQSEQGTGVPSLPNHFIALLFDDTHMIDADLMYARNSTIQFLDSLGPQDRVAFASTSGQFTQEFSEDKDALKRSLTSLSARPNLTDVLGQCPRVSYYLAHLVDTVNDQDAFQVVLEDTLQCAFGGDKTSAQMAGSLAKSAIRQTVAMAQADNNSVFDHMQAVLRRLAGMPGERTMIFVSSGFSLTEDRTRFSKLIDLATTNRIPIDTLDARGLYISGVGNISAGGIPNKPITTTVSPTSVTGPLGSRTSAGVNLAGQQNANFRAQAQDELTLVLQEFADGTAGTFVQHTNDLAGGMQKMATPPEFSYVLAFSPQNPKPDGNFHKLKVELTGNQKYEINARRGYYAPKKTEDPEEFAKGEVEQAVFGRDEIADMPMELRTQYFKKTADDAQLSIITRLDVKGLHFAKLDDRNCNKLTIVTAIFDGDGNYVLGQEKTVNLKLTTAGYQHVLNSGLGLKTSFDLKPGKYMVRQVVREHEGAQMSARSGAVEIPN